MAVFTEVSLDEAREFVVPFELGQLVSLAGIASGIENTNYFLTTTQGEFVLTLFERLNFSQLPFYLELMLHLAKKGIPVPAPQPHKTGPHAGKILHELNGKPAALVEKLNGRSQLAPDVHHCEQLGAMLAKMHLAGEDFPINQPNLRGLSWWVEVAPEILPYVNTGITELLMNEMAFQMELSKESAYERLPRGPIHADLFRNNAMFDGDEPANEKLSGFFDFYFAGVDTFLFDVAVCLNDWCINLDTGEQVDERANALLGAYIRERPLTEDECALLPALLRSAAMRFWVSRLWDYYLPREAQLLKPHDPTHFERILKHRRECPWGYPF